MPYGNTLGGQFLTFPIPWSLFVPAIVFTVIMRKRKNRWPYAGAGILFSFGTGADREILLGKRLISPQKGQWSIPGGGLSRQDSGSLFNCSVRETAEEVFRYRPLPLALKGCLEHPLEEEYFKRTKIHLPLVFKFNTYLVPLKKKPQMESGSNHEFEEMKWFPVNDLPKGLHVGVRYSLSILGIG